MKSLRGTKDVNMPNYQKTNSLITGTIILLIAPASNIVPATAFFQAPHFIYSNETTFYPRTRIDITIYKTFGG